VASGDQALQELVAIEEIKRLKARYFRLIDSQGWEELPSVFTSDARFDFEYPEMQFADPQEFIAMSKGALDGARSVHRGYLPEIQLTAVDTAVAIWAMEDRVELPPSTGPSWHGYGHYHDEYRTVEGQWKIASLRLTRVRIDQVGGPGGAGPS